MSSGAGTNNSSVLAAIAKLAGIEVDQIDVNEPLATNIRWADIDNLTLLLTEEFGLDSRAVTKCITVSELFELSGKSTEDE